jgi:hypothetical protein
MRAYVYQLDAQGREQLPGCTTTAYQSVRALERYWLRPAFPPGRYRVYLHHNEDRSYGPADRIALITLV